MIAAQIEALAAKLLYDPQPWKVVPSDGKPIIASKNGGNLFRGFIATWPEADLVVALVNNLPAIVTALRQAEAAPGVVEAEDAARDFMLSNWPNWDVRSAEVQRSLGKVFKRFLALARQHVAREDAPVLIEREVDADCGCPEETWDAFGLHLNMHLSAGKPSNAHADAGDAGEWEMSVTAATIDQARAAIFGWAQSIFAAAPATDAGKALS